MSFRDGPFENLKVPLTWTAAVALIAAGAGALLLLLNDKREQLDAKAYGARGAFDAIAAPANGMFAHPVRWVGQASDWVDDYFFAVSENRRLKKQVAELEAWRDAAVALKNVNSRYEAMLQIRTEPPVPMVTARAVSESRGPFVNARLIDSGSRKGIKVGNPVINEHGLVGRVVGTTASVSRVLLLTDVASRTPVLVNRTDARAILVGDGSGNPKLEFIRGKDAVQAGDQILSSGDGGVFPRGLPIGVAAKGLDGSWRVKLYSDRGAVDFVRVLLFEDFAQLVNPEALNAPPLTALNKAAPPPSAELAARIEALHPTPHPGAVAAAQPPAVTLA
ncbi:rod shape-determining protein MreC, partial [Caulobacter sp. 17J65-9]|uniref:rod shape-determining protein MreC n=1 Tax=Caulobacter sp. 17J65-9 TaxID=2709382 RepID=UPI0013C73A38